MRSTAGRDWVPLFKDSTKAVERGSWMLEEMDIVFRSKADLALLRVEFTALGFGHYHLSGMLTSRDWHHWRFHGPIPWEVRDLAGNLLAKIIDVMEVV